MLPRWFRIVVAAEVGALVVLVVLLVHLASGSARAVGQVVDWARPHLAQSSTPLPAPALPRATAAALTPPGLGSLGGPLLHQLDKDTEATAAGEMHLIARMEEVLRQRVEDAIAATPRNR
jgi:hypothetical protein